MAFPVHRPRRLRSTPAVRSLVRETDLRADRLIYPLFVVPGRDVVEPVASMPGVEHRSVDRAVERAREVFELGIRAVLLFGLPRTKDEQGSEAFAPDGAVQQAVAALKDALPDLLVVTDVCLCAYTSHGHCGILTADGRIDNDATLEQLARVAVSHARAGADWVAPSDMMDGRVAAIRRALDQEGFTDTAILSYAVKYASAFYGPFREAAHSAPAFGDRRTHQMDPANVREALREVALDLEEGADLVMVKPALAYLDVIRAVRQQFPVPVVAYNVSGEYSLVKAAARLGWVDERAVVLEALTAMRRAGADAIITYHAPDVARWLA
ncbi:porphobilinogen synthase [Thermaerobacter marianensis DSM 12885]|uniref:Delta-aminolevulinic acid dehydratase n=1 Tax=Thermaerobacter marianensis (strain ATCC 700841 / DSM 12885 / JCM 10246 / 7p75a) TaxID=644966 RepID=E6SLS3_THEM7|nr:porphobilinogen synthase [Thermaerobacter marianensis]ADU51372.1 porphobilinogen synthase [Thermaerobacter marianensis DSM 12885]